MIILRKSLLKIKFYFRFIYINRLNNDFFDLFLDVEDILKFENLCFFSRFIGNCFNYF